MCCWTGQFTARGNNSCLKSCCRNPQMTEATEEQQTDCVVQRLLRQSASSLACNQSASVGLHLFRQNTHHPEWNLDGWLHIENFGTDLMDADHPTKDPVSVEFDAIFPAFDGGDTSLHSHQQSNTAHSRIQGAHQSNDHSPVKRRAKREMTSNDCIN